MVDPGTAALILGGANFLGGLGSDPQKKWADKFGQARWDWLQEMKRNKPTGPVISSAMIARIMSGLNQQMQPEFSRAAANVTETGSWGAPQTQQLLARETMPILAGERGNLEKANISMTANRDQAYLDMIARLLG